MIQLLLPSPWPDDVLGLGPREFGVVGACVDCEAILKFTWQAVGCSWVTYGGIHLCLMHAKRRNDEVVL